MELRPFLKEDFDTYCTWYADPDLNRELGPMDNEWLEYVLNESPPKEFSFFEDGSLVAVIGTEAPETGEDSTWYITAIAVNPAMKRKGIGKRALQLLLEHHSARDNPPKAWIAWVSLNNSVAKFFFTELGWSGAVKTDANDMYQFRLEMN